MPANDIHAYLFTRRVAELLEIDEATLFSAMTTALYERSSTLVIFKSDGTVDVEGPYGVNHKRNKRTTARDFEAAARRLGRLPR